MVKLKSPKRILNTKFIPVYLFLIISAGLFFLMGYPEVASKGPFSRHSYRQGDSYAFALNYYYENNKFMEPSVLCVCEEKGGRTVSEFPVLYYLTAQIWKLTGVSPLVLRLINLAILFIGLFYLYKLSFEILRDHFWASTVSLLMFSSPLLGFYGFNFIPNTPALGFALIASYYSYKYHTSSKVRFLLLATILFTLGALIKISSLFAFLAINAVLFIRNIRQVKQKPRALLLQLASAVFVFALVSGWYLFAKDYNYRNLDGLFRQDIIPIWDLSSEHVQRIKDSAYTNTIIYFLNPVALIALAVFFITSVIFRKKTDQALLAVTAVLFAGIILFILLFFDGMDDHEYFLIDVTVIIPAVTITFLTTLKNLSPGLYHSASLRLSAFILLLFSLNYNMVMTRVHYNPHDKLVTRNIPLPNRVMEYWKWAYWDWEIKLKRYEGIVPYIRNLGIRFEDKIISIPDESPNRTLTLLHQKGFTDYHYWNNYEGIRRTQRKIELGAKYLIVQGDENLLREDVAPFTQNLIGEYNGIRIYKLSGE